LRRPAFENAIVDGYGRSRLFHGVNVVYKHAPWLPHVDGDYFSDTFSDFDAKTLAAWGMNFVRLGMMWPGIEPSRGHIDLDYLNRVMRIVKMLGRHGIYTLLDVHQDIGPGAFCGEGVPHYYVAELLANASSRPGKAHPFPYPSNVVNPKLDGVNAITGWDHKFCNDVLTAAGDAGGFGNWVATDQNGAIWRTLLDPDSDFRLGYMQMWDAVARFVSMPEHRSPYLLGYELLNEPVASCLDGCEVTNTTKHWGNKTVHSLGTTGSVSTPAQQKMYLDLFTEASYMIRQHDDESLIMFEFGVDANTQGTNRSAWAKFDQKPGSPRDENFVLAYHSYQCSSWSLKGEGCAKVQEDFIDFNKAQAKKLNTASFLTEFGAIGEGDSVGLDNLAGLVSQMNGALQSWSYWAYKFMDDITTCNFREGIINASTGHIDNGKFHVLTAPYAPSAQGRHLYLDWNAEAQRLVTTVQVDPVKPSYLAPTEYFLGPAGLHATVYCKDDGNKDVDFWHKIDPRSKLLNVQAHGLTKVTNVTCTVQITFGEAHIGGYGSGAKAAAQSYWQGDEGYERRLSNKYKQMVNRARIQNGGASVQGQEVIHAGSTMQNTEVAQHPLEPLNENPSDNEQSEESKLTRELWSGIESAATPVTDDELVQKAEDPQDRVQVTIMDEEPSSIVQEQAETPLMDGTEANQAAESMLPLYEFVEQVTKVTDSSHSD